MRSIIISLIIMGMSCSTASAIEEYANFTRFKDNIKYLISYSQLMCQEHSEKYLDVFLADGPVSNPKYFLQACGHGLQDYSLRGTDWKIVFDQKQRKSGLFLMFGVYKDISFEGQSYRIIIGRADEYFLSGQGAEKKNSRPRAILFEKVKSKQKWQNVWNFVHPIKDEWLKPDVLFPKTQNIRKELAFFLDRVWRQEVVRNFERLIWNLKDQR